MILNGKIPASEIKRRIKEKIASNKARPPALAVILVGDDPASQIYVKRKTHGCEEVGIRSVLKIFSSETAEDVLIQEIESLNNDPEIDGILVQLPLPKHIDPLRVTESVDPTKDIDGFHPYNVGKILIGLKDCFVPCTPLGIMRLLEYYAIPLAGKNVVVIGRSNIVGKPLAALLMQNNEQSVSSLTVLSRFSSNIKEHCLRADIIIVAVGIPHFITTEMVKQGSVVIDIGINKVGSGSKIVGDADFEQLTDKCSSITPVPGGVGPMTIAMLLENTLLSYEKRMKPV